MIKEQKSMHDRFVNFVMSDFKKLRQEPSTVLFLIAISAINTGFSFLAFLGVMLLWVSIFIL